MSKDYWVENPTWEETLNGSASLSDFISAYHETIMNCFGQLLSGDEATEKIKAQYTIDKEHMLKEGIPASEFPEPIFRRDDIE